MRNNIIEFSKIGFIEEIEFLPNFFDSFNSKQKMRQLFLNLINCMIPKECNFTKQEQRDFSRYNLNQAFKSKIQRLKPNSNVFVKPNKTTFVFNFCLNSTITINNYMENKHSRKFISNSNLIPLANFLNFCFYENKLEILIDKNFLFHEFIMKKLRKMHPDKMIIDEGNSLSIVKNKKTLLKIYNSWKFINKNNPNIKEELNYAIEDVKSNINNNIYLIYPKNKDFNKHIELNVEGLENSEYKIKVIPYSLRSILRQTI